MCTSSHPVVSQGPTTPHVSPCHKVFLSYNSYIRKRTRKIRILQNSWLLENNLLKQDGPISGDGGDCQEDFLCCRWQGLPNLHPCPPNTSHSKTTSHPNSTQLKSTPSKTSPTPPQFLPLQYPGSFCKYLNHLVKHLQAILTMRWTAIAKREMYFRSFLKSAPMPTFALRRY